uniref:Uncharacterized protein n=1 Tax=Phenylobacterium glaciei TaxID=2803784 RepID=A0A974P5T2_9CAUL|nr:hypothetical protein JKL49_06685 [Phenylobacterium glaciei]
MDADEDGRRQGLLNRRGLLLGAAGLTLAACAPKASGGGANALKVSSYGGNFEEAMSKYVYPVFEKASGIKVESIPSRPASNSCSSSSRPTRPASPRWTSASPRPWTSTAAATPASGGFAIPSP